MKQTLLIPLLLLLAVCSMNAQMTFINKDGNSNFPRIDISNVRTKLFHKINGGTKLWQYWDQVPQNYENGDGRSRYKMTVYSTDAVASRTFEISYTIPYGKSGLNPYGSMTATFVYKDKRPKKIITEQFTLKNETK